MKNWRIFTSSGGSGRSTGGRFTGDVNQPRIGHRRLSMGIITQNGYGAQIMRLKVMYCSHEGDIGSVQHQVAPHRRNKSNATQYEPL